MRTCQFCAEEIQDAAIVCKHCGRDLATPAPAVQATARRHPGLWKLLVAFAVAVVIVAWGASLWNRSPALTIATPDETTSAPARLKNASEDQRASLLKSAIEGSGARCGEVISTFFQGAGTDGAVFWNARCLGGQGFAVRISDDRTGSIKVLDCVELRNITGVECFQALK